MEVEVLSALNIPPIARAGSDQLVTLPVSSVILNGGASSDADGTIVSYQWQYTSGPASFSIVAPSAAQTSVSGLTEGVYQFRLVVTDDSSAVAFDTVQITVLPQPTSVTRQILVNLFGGANPQSTGGWNNWNIGGTGLSNLNSGALRYSDGSLSGIAAQISFTQAISDNGATYGGTVVPAAVWRYTSHATINRTITLTGLNNAARYDISFFAGRAASTTNANSTRFSIGSQSVVISTDNNKTAPATFTNIAPVNGQMVINVARVNTFNYINGFTITETIANAPGSASPLIVQNADVPGLTDGAVQAATTVQSADLSELQIRLSPNPIKSGRLALSFGAGWKGTARLQLTNAVGSTLASEQLQVPPGGGTVAASIDFGRLAPGVYFVRVAGAAGWQIIRLLKQ